MIHVIFFSFVNSIWREKRNSKETEANRNYSLEKKNDHQKR